MFLTPDERRALLAVAGLLTLGLLVRVTLPGPVIPEGGGDSLLVVLAGRSEGGRSEPAAAPPPGLLEEGRLRINEADLEDLTTLPGIGPVLGQRILEERARVGALRSLEELRRVRGIGPRIAERLEPLLSFRAPPGTLAAECRSSMQAARQAAPSRRETMAK